MTTEPQHTDPSIDGVLPAPTLASRRGPSRRTWGALAACGLVVGGLAVASQVAWAGDDAVTAIAATPTTAAPTTAAPPTTEVAAPEPDAEHSDHPWFDMGAWEDWSGHGMPWGMGAMGGVDVGGMIECMTGELGIDPTFGAEGGFERLAELFGHGAVNVITPDEASMLQFGEGDGSITITKSGDAYTVTTSGDVSETDLSGLIELPADWPEVPADVMESFAECVPLGAPAPSGSGG
jgi:hypothetical protein